MRVSRGSGFALCYRSVSQRSSILWEVLTCERVPPKSELLSVADWFQSVKADVVGPSNHLDDSPHGPTSGAATNEGISMLIQTENFEIDLGLWDHLFLRWGTLQVWACRESGQPFWWFAQEELGHPWQRWGFGRTLIVQRVADPIRENA